MKPLSEVIAAELSRIAAGNGGVLRPSDVVTAARPKSSPLHGRFTWDDSEAAEQYRLLQARQIIRVTVHMLPPEFEQVEPCRVWVSLMNDRTKEDGGYRSLVNVLSDKELRGQLLSEALAEMESFTAKYRQLSELSEVFAAMRKVRGKGR